MIGYVYDVRHHKRQDILKGSIMRVEGIWCGTNTPVAIEIKGQKIISCNSIPMKPFLPWLSPGFVDIQINGYAGFDYSNPALEAHHIEAIVCRLAASGTFYHCPTIITAPQKTIVENCRTISREARRNAFIGKTICGIHIEGPYISAEDGPRGAHDPQFIRNPDVDEFEEWQDAAQGMIKIVTLAPELPGALHFIEHISRTGVIAAIGHTAASPGIIRNAVRAGARLSTHLGNGCHGMVPRLKNYLWEQLASDEIAASIIADGFHLPDAVIKVIARAKGLSNLILISDVAHLAGSLPGIMYWGSMKVEVHPDGHLGLAGTQFLAGAGHLLNRDIAQFIRATEVSVSDAIRLCTDNPRKLLGLTPSGQPRTGDFATFVAFKLSSDATAIEIVNSLFEGKDMNTYGIREP